jgi:hypothetical protein
MVLPSLVFPDLMQVTYCPYKISCTIFYSMHAPLQCIKNALAYFALAINYTCKMFMHSIPVPNVIKLFTSIIYKFT